MNSARFNEFCATLPAATLSVQWDNNHVWKVGGKMFAIGEAPSDEFFPISFKAGEIAFEMLQERDGLRPAPYLQRAKWIQITDAAAMEAEELEGYIAESHKLIAAKLTKKLQRELGLLGEA